MQMNDLIRHLTLEKNFSVLMDASEEDLTVPRDRFDDVDHYTEADDVPDELVDRWLETIASHHDHLPLVGVDPAEFAYPLERWLSEPLRRLAPLVHTVLVRPIAVQGGLQVTLVLQGEPPADLTLSLLQEVAVECQAELRGPAEPLEGERPRDVKRRRRSRPSVAFDLLVLTSAADPSTLHSRLRALTRAVPGRARVSVIPWHLDPAAGSVWTAATLARLLRTRYLRSILRSPTSEAALLDAYEHAKLSLPGIVAGAGLAWILTGAGLLGLATLDALETGLASLVQVLAAVIGVAVSISCLRIRRRATEQALCTAGAFIATFYGTLLFLTWPASLDIWLGIAATTLPIGLMATLLGYTSEITP